MSPSCCIPPSWFTAAGISSGEMGGALEVLVGLEAKGLSAGTVSRLKQIWAEEYRRWHGQRLDEDRGVYVWVDGVRESLLSWRGVLLKMHGTIL